MSNCAITVHAYTSKIYSYRKLDSMPSKEQVFLILFYCILCMCIFVCIIYINNTPKGNTSLMLNKLLLPLP